MKHLKITFVDGSEEELESKYVTVEVYSGILYTFQEAVYGSNRERGPTYVIHNIKKYEWLEGYK